MRIIALDIGDVRIGVAVSDFMRIIANPRETYIRKNEDADIEYFIQLAKKEEVDTFVVGLPINITRFTALFEQYHYTYAKHLWPDRQIPNRWQF